MKAGRQPSTRRKHNTMKQTYFWPIYGEQDEVAFTWSASRGKQHAIEQLSGFNGTLLSDGYAVYSQVIDTLNSQGQHITHAACWAHTRRYFEKALDYHPKEAQHALAEIQKLYKVEHIYENRRPMPMIQCNIGLSTVNLLSPHCLTGYTSNVNAQNYCLKTP